MKKTTSPKMPERTPGCPYTFECCNGCRLRPADPRIKRLVLAAREIGDRAHKVIGIGNKYVCIEIEQLVALRVALAEWKGEFE